MWGGIGEEVARGGAAEWAGCCLVEEQLGLGLRLFHFAERIYIIKMKDIEINRQLINKRFGYHINSAILLC